MHSGGQACPPLCILCKSGRKLWINREKRLDAFHTLLCYNNYNWLQAVFGAMRFARPAAVKKPRRRGGGENKDFSPE